MTRDHMTGTGVFLLRVALGAMFLAHGFWLKMFVFTMPGTAAFFVSLGLPGWFAYAVAVSETIGGLMLVFGVQARWAALVLTPVLSGATWAHAGNGWLFTNEGGGWEYPAYLTLLSAAQVLLGDGRFALWPSTLPRLGRWTAWEAAR